MVVVENFRNSVVKIQKIIIPDAPKTKMGSPKQNSSRIPEQEQYTEMLGPWIDHPIGRITINWHTVCDVGVPVFRNFGRSKPWMHGIMREFFLGWRYFASITDKHTLETPEKSAR